MSVNAGVTARASIITSRSVGVDVCLEAGMVATESCSSASASNSCCVCRADQVPVVFSRAFLRCFSNNLTSSNNYLHSSAQRIAQRIIVFAGKARTIRGMQVQGSSLLLLLSLMS